MSGSKFHNSVERENRYPSVTYLLNGLENTTLRALIAYTAYCHNKDAIFIEALILERFGASAIGKIERKDFDMAIRYLVDLIPKELLN